MSNIPTTTHPDSYEGEVATPEQIEEYNRRLKRVEEIHPSKVSRVLALCTSGIDDEDIQSITKIPIDLIEVIINRVIPDTTWLTLVGEASNDKKVTYEILRATEVASNVITETSMAKKADKVVNQTLDYLVEKTENNGFKTIGEAHNTLRSMASLYPVLSRRGRLEEQSEAAKETPTSVVINQAVLNYDKDGFKNPSTPIVNKEGQVVGVKTEEGTKVVDIMPRRELDKMATLQQQGVPVAEQIARKVANQNKEISMAEAEEQGLIDNVTGSKELGHEEIISILDEIDSIDLDI